MKESFYAWSALDQLTELDRGKQERQMRVTLARVMQEMAESLTAQSFTMPHQRCSRSSPRATYTKGRQKSSAVARTVSLQITAGPKQRKYVEAS